MLCADAFLYTGALFLVTQGVPAIAATLARIDPNSTPGWMQAIGPLSMIVSLAVGALLAWRMHGHEIHGASWLGMIAGTVLGGPLLIAAFFALFMLGRFIPNPVPSVEGPWGLVAVVTVAVVAFLIVPIVDAMRDFATDRRVHVRLDWMRLAAFAVAAALVAWTTVLGLQTGSELAEAGMFMVPVAAASACAVLGADLLESWRAKRAATGAPLAQA